MFNKERKAWLQSFVVYMSANFIFSLILIFSDSEETQITGMAQIIVFLIWGWITYCCTYRKRGTRWITFVICTLPFAILKEFVSAGDELFVLIVYSITFLPLATWFWISSIKLLSVNKMIEKDAFLNNFFELQAESLKTTKKEKNDGFVRKAKVFFINFTKDEDHVANGLLRVGVVVGFCLAVISVVFGIVIAVIDNCYYESRLIVVINCLSVSIGVSIFLFSTTVFIMKGIGWIIKGFRKSNKIENTLS